MSFRTARAFVLLSVMMLGAACSPAAQQRADSDPASGPGWLHTPRPPRYVLEVGDVFDLKLFQYPELSESAVVVRPDGGVNLQLVGDVTARQKTVDELVEELRDRYTRAGLRDPRLAIILRKAVGLRVYVGGEVNTPGMVTHEGHLTLSRAVFQAGGPKRSAKLRNVVLLRDPRQPSPTDPLFAVVDMNELLEGGRDPLLEPYDVIFVPKTQIAKLNDLVDQYIVKLIPITFSAGFSYSIGRFKEFGK
jgi:protein involved in polysaccharide export with SLBB domain